MATTYENVGWEASTPLSAKNMRILETMEPCIKSSIDEHTHPTIHYSKAESDSMFFGSGLEAGLDADLIDGKTLSEIFGGQVPNGLHLAWNGVEEDFTDGYLNDDTRWHLADGGTYNGIYTTDMRGFFPRSSNTNSETGTGGANSVVLGGTVTVAGHALTIAEIPLHWHNFIDSYRSTWEISGAADYPFTLIWQTSRTGTTENAGSGSAHTHPNTTISMNSIEISPSYKALYFICKVSD